MISRIEHQGVLIRECPLPGETRADDVFPSHASGIRLSRARWMLLYSTRRFRGVDDDCSIVYQIRDGSAAGRVVKEGFLARSTGDWDALGDGAKHWKQHGHPVAFGVPRGALVKGRPAPNANLFVAKWRRHAVIVERDPRYGDIMRHDEALSRRTQAVEWVQFRLNEREDDIEAVRPAAVMRQVGFESGPAFCSAERIGSMNQSFMPAVPFNEDRTEWAICNHFDQARVAALRYRFNPRAGLYEWVETGPFIDAPAGISEASLARFRGSWVIAARQRSEGGVAWVRAEDPFAKMPPPVVPKEPVTNSPLTVFVCADGALRLFTGDPTISSHRNGRDPLYGWEIDPDKGFACSDRRVIFDSVAAGLPIRVESVPRVDFGKLQPHGGGRTQFLTHRVRTKTVNNPSKGLIVTAEEKSCCAVYFAAIEYADECPDPWDFTSP